LLELVQLRNLGFCDDFIRRIASHPALQILRPDDAERLARPSVPVAGVRLSLWSA
jgi:hypothetical protein